MTGREASRGALECLQRRFEKLAESPFRIVVALGGSDRTASRLPVRVANVPQKAVRADQNGRVAWIRIAVRADSGAAIGGIDGGHWLAGRQPKLESVKQILDAVEPDRNAQSRQNWLVAEQLIDDFYECCVEASQLACVGDVGRFLLDLILVPGRVQSFGDETSALVENAALASALKIGDMLADAAEREARQAGTQPPATAARNGEREGAKPHAANAQRQVNLNAKFFALLSNNPDAAGWSASRVARELGCSASGVKATEAWKTSNRIAAGSRACHGPEQGGN